MASPINRRFQFPTGGDTEYAEKYRPGGFHPVLLNDVFNNRYRVVSKLGFGSFSTVWLSVDEPLNRYVALKIVEAKSSKEGQELRLLTSLDQTIDHPGKHHVQQLLDHFEHEGPNGRHQCLVFEPMGRNFNQYLWDYQWNERKSWSAFDSPSPLPGLPLHFTRHLCKQLVMALDYLHSQSIMHRDIQPGNILFAPNFTLDEWEYESGAYQIVPVRVDGQPLGDGDPKYLLDAEPVTDGVPVTAPPPDFRIILADLGSASTFEDCNNGLHTYPYLLQAPEVLLKLPFDEKADIWNLGCMIFEILFSTRPFSPGNVFGTQEEKEDELLEGFVECLGPMPQLLWSKVPQPLAAVDASGNLRKHTAEEVEMDCRYYSLREVMEMHRVKGMSDAELNAFESFIRSTLQYEPDKRPSTQELLQHPWIVDF